jgi:4-hydroxybenzoyl-CoA thioesterase
MQGFAAQRTVRFSDCDPAGIVFFPQYLVMLNGVVEDWFGQALGLPYAGLIGPRRLGLPTVRLELDFTAISRHGDRLRWEVSLAHLGRSSFTLLHDVMGHPDEGGGVRLRARQVLVCTSLDTHRAQALPDDLRAAMQAYGARAGMGASADAVVRRGP